MKYNEYPYKRLSLEESKLFSDRLLPKFEPGNNLQTQIDAINSMNE